VHAPIWQIHLTAAMPGNEPGLQQSGLATIKHENICQVSEALTLWPTPRVLSQIQMEAEKGRFRFCSGSQVSYCSAKDGWGLKAKRACRLRIMANHLHGVQNGTGAGEGFEAGHRPHAALDLTGIYSWDAEQQMPEGFRPLRLPGRLLRAA
jgi:hypothetical protein